MWSPSKYITRYSKRAPGGICYIKGHFDSSKKIYLFCNKNITVTMLGCCCLTESRVIVFLFSCTEDQLSSSKNPDDILKEKDLASFTHFSWAWTSLVQLWRTWRWCLTKRSFFTGSNIFSPLVETDGILFPSCYFETRRTVRLLRTRM